MAKLSANIPKAEFPFTCKKMKIETVQIECLSLDPANARKHGSRNLDAIKASLRRFGQQKPIVVDSKNVVRAGNGTLQAAKALKWKEIKIVRSDLPPSELTAFAIADNRTAELAEWDCEILAVVLKKENASELGFDTGEMDAFARAAGESRAGPQLSLAEHFEVVVECEDESEQKDVFDRLNAEGYSCRLFTL
jgi:ParB-like chromosome segregation protein Spo0J